jgi:hypothetical protein
MGTRRRGEGEGYQEGRGGGWRGESRPEPEEGAVEERSARTTASGGLWIPINTCRAAKFGKRPGIKHRFSSSIVILM